MKNPPADGDKEITARRRSAPLEGLRVLDLAERPGAFAAKLLADLGADTIKIEPPGGDGMRRIGPFWRDEPHPDRSISFWFYNTSKRSLTLDVTRSAGRDIFARLAAGADVVIETSPPGELERLGLGYEALNRVNANLVLVSITPFGQTGPRRHWGTSGIVAEAVSGMLYVNGAPGEPPIATPGTQAYQATGAYAAIAAMAALLARERAGGGQWVDISIQEATAAAVEHVAALFHQDGTIQRRTGKQHWTGDCRVGRCRDGHILHCTLGDWTSLIEWVKADGKAKDLAEPVWEDFVHRRSNCSHLFDVLDQWAKGYSSAELMKGAQIRRIPYAEVRSPEAVFEDPQLTERGFFVTVPEPDLGTSISYPGTPFRMSQTPGSVRRPPRTGEHTDEILREVLQLEAAEIERLRADGIV